MFNQTCFENFLGFGNAGEILCFTVHTLEQMGLEPKPLIQLGLLRESPIARDIECRSCGEFVDILPQKEHKEIILYADCPVCGKYRLIPSEYKRYQADFSYLMEIIRINLRCTGTPVELVTNALWSLGRSPLAGQSREVFVCAGINSSRNREILELLPVGKTPILLVIGDAPRPGKIENFSSDRIFLVSDLIRVDGGNLSFDASLIKNQLVTVTAIEPDKSPTTGKNSKRGNLIIKLKTELREYMLGNYAAILQAESNDRIYNFPELKQSDLAKMLNVPRVYIKRAIESDLELQTLFESANNRNSTVAYARKASR